MRTRLLMGRSRGPMGTSCAHHEKFGHISYIVCYHRFAGSDSPLYNIGLRCQFVHTRQYYLGAVTLSNTSDSHLSGELLVIFNFGYIVPHGYLVMEFFADCMP